MAAVAVVVVVFVSPQTTVVRGREVSIEVGKDKAGVVSVDVNLDVDVGGEEFLAVVAILVLDVVVFQ